MPFNCDVCGDEKPYSECKVFQLRGFAEVIICKDCIKKAR